MNWVWRFLEGSGRQGKVERYCYNVICGAPTTIKVKELRWDERCIKNYTDTQGEDLSTVKVLWPPPHTHTHAHTHTHTRTHICNRQFRTDVGLIGQISHRLTHKRTRIRMLIKINPYKHSVPFFGYRQTVQTQIRRRRTRRLIRVVTVC